MEKIRKVTSIPTENLRASKAKTDSNNFAFVATFNSNNKKVFPLIQTSFKSLQQSHETKECFKDIKLIKSQRQASSLKELLLKLYTQIKKSTAAKSALKLDVLVVITSMKAVFIKGNI